MLKKFKIVVILGWTIALLAITNLVLIFGFGIIIEFVHHIILVLALANFLTGLYLYKKISQEEIELYKKMSDEVTEDVTSLNEKLNKSFAIKASNNLWN